MEMWPGDLKVYIEFVKSMIKLKLYLADIMIGGSCIATNL